MASSAMRDRSDVFSGEGPLVVRLSRSNASVRLIALALDGVQTVDQFAGVAVRIVAGHVEKRLWVIASGVRSSWQVLPRTRCSATRASSGEHGVEAVGEFAELVPASS